MIKFTKHPGSGYIWVVCDVCGGDFYRKDTVLVKDPFNTQHGLVVCKGDLDQRNDQALPNKIRESTVPSPELIRVEKADQFAENENDDTAPSAPRNLIATLSPIDDVIVLMWDGPEAPGSSSITGYEVKRAVPLGSYTTIQSPTATSATYYEDTTGDVEAIYTYTVAAINSFGTGPVSNIGYYPSEHPTTFLTNEDGLRLTDGTGRYLTIEY